MTENGIARPKKKRNGKRWLNKKVAAQREKKKPSSIEIPAVTPDDLYNFHQNHFPGGPLPAELCWEPEVEYYEEFEDDGLGYYPDGTKRTLTDEQIAIFRHSEIQRLIMESELSPAPDEVLESLKVDGGAENPSTSSDQMDMSEDDYQPEVKLGAKLPSPTPDQVQKKKESLRGLPKTLKDAVEQDRILEKLDKLEYTSQGSDYTNRRKARELDEIKTEIIELDY